MSFDEISRTIAQDQHLLPGETLEQGLKRACDTYGTNSEHAERLYNYAVKQWFMFASPVLANAGNDRGLPISCFLNTVPDSREGLLDHYTENAWLTSSGGGIGGCWSDIRSVGRRTSRGLTTTGLIPFVHVVDSEILAFNQGDTRRGAYAAYLDISHPEVLEFIEMRDPTGGDIHRKNLNIHHGITVTDDFMNAVADNNDWRLIDPHTKETTEILPARTLWMKIINMRLKLGEPYLYFIDTANRYLPEQLKDRGLRISHSNLCTEIMLPTNKDRTAVCCLSSVNAAKYDEWMGDEQFISDMIEMLDNVLQDFIDRAPKNLWRAVESARRERSVGLGVMGFHTLLMKRMVPFDSAAAIGLNRNLFKFIHDVATRTSLRLGTIRGEAPDMVGSGHRMAHRIAVAPNATNSLVCNLVSASIEPISGNSYTHKTKTVNFTWRNKELMKHIGTPEDNPDVWKSIHTNNGSVQHLDIGKRVKDVFKTAWEIDQNYVILHAHARQEFICQGQSVNLFFNKGDDIGYISRVHKAAWEKGLKSLYYARTRSVRRPENISKQIEREIKEDANECLACEG
jgi:ribonucleoside-diphosphate reductase alpha chain